jgi:hypothetical protein
LAWICLVRVCWSCSICSTTLVFIVTCSCIFYWFVFISPTWVNNRLRLSMTYSHRAPSFFFHSSIRSMSNIVCAEGLVGLVMTTPQAKQHTARFDKTSNMWGTHCYAQSRRNSTVTHQILEPLTKCSLQCLTSAPDVEIPIRSTAAYAPISALSPIATRTPNQPPLASTWITRKRN